MSNKMSNKKVTMVCMLVEHEGLDDSDILSAIQYWSENMETSLEDDNDIPVEIDPNKIVVVTA